MYITRYIRTRFADERRDNAHRRNFQSGSTVTPWDDWWCKAGDWKELKTQFILLTPTDGTPSARRVRHYNTYDARERLQVHIPLQIWVGHVWQYNYYYSRHRFRRYTLKLIEIYDNNIIRLFYKPTCATHFAGSRAPEYR